MVEYGNGVSQVGGQVAGGSDGGGRSIDVGASAGQLISNSVDMLSTLPPAALLGLFVVVVLGLLILKRAF
jgi:hypothetical protein